MNDPETAAGPDENAPANEQPWWSPCTDPTNPDRDEKTGERVPAARANERRVNEPGLTDRDRQERL